MDAKAKRQALRRISNGVYVLTSRSGVRYGAATVSWVSQVSFKPPLVMAAVRRDSNVFACLAESGCAVLHVVGERQQELARRFFHTTLAEGESINGEPFVAGTTDAPVLAALPVHVECRVARIADSGGDHALVILEVVEAQCRERVRPLTIAESPWEYGG
ncbi:MAG: flavin reductase family protein [Burkholderiales bacterium]